MTRYGELTRNAWKVLRKNGPHAAIDRAKLHLNNFIERAFRKGDSPAAILPRDDMHDFVDVLFINGCAFSVPHPIRYRVDHQAEQLEAVGMSTRIVNAWELSEDHARLARAFIIFRCPYTDEVGSFIELAHLLNKVVLFDIDDLVIDTVYTDQIPYLNTMSASDRKMYDADVMRMGKTMRLCDGAITTTEELAAELRKYVNPVFVNRNVASEEMTALSERALRECTSGREQGDECFSIGYFSGSITHNDDFRMILPAIVRFMERFEDVCLHVVGELDLPEELAPFSARVVKEPFSPWQDLPRMVSKVDVNLIPLADTIFNRAKSENKWVEAALVKVPSVASRVGALADSIEDGVDGTLCDSVDDWYEALVELHEDADLRARLAAAAYSECSSSHVSCGTGMPLANFLLSFMKPSVAMVLPGLKTSGGTMVAKKHAAILEEAGNDATILHWEPSRTEHWVDVDGMRLPVLLMNEACVRGRFDKLIATMWTTVQFVTTYSNAGDRFYLVQGCETGFYEPGEPERREVSKTYGCNPQLTYCTISTWCRGWLKSDYGKDARYAPNGIDLSLFEPCERDWSGKIRILIEGDSSVEWKNMDEAFAIIAKLDPAKYEVWHMSYEGGPKPWYRVDKFLRSVPHEEVGEIYRQCHILLKTSILESFSYPPLEMMATGGAAVVLANEGNAAYCVDGENCLMFNRGDDDHAAELIEQLVSDVELRERLHEGGIATAEAFSWDNLQEEILALYK